MFVNMVIVIEAENTFVFKDKTMLLVQATHNSVPRHRHYYKVCLPGMNYYREF